MSRVFRSRKTNGLFLTFAVFFLVIVGTWRLVLSQAEATPTPQEVTSIFEADTCAPPCWFGLVAGESTATDVIEMLSSNLDLFRSIPDSSEGYRDFETDVEPLVDGFYEFYWGVRPQPNLRPTESFLKIEDQKLAWMRIGAPAFISIHQVTERLGLPDEVRIGNFSYIYDITLFYPDLKLILMLTADVRDCEMSHMSDHFGVDYLYYYPADSRDAFELERRLNYYIQVPADLWRSWFSDEITEACEDEFAQFFSSPHVVATRNSLSTQAAATLAVSQATHSAQVRATVTARASERLTATPVPQ